MPTTVTISVRRLPGAGDLPLPAAASAGSSGVDLRAAVAGPCVIQPGQRLLVPTGLALEIPPGWEGQLRPRSGLALRHGIGMVNAPGTIDSDYRGEVAVVLINHGTEPFTVERGDRIAQLVLAPVGRIEWEEAATLPDSGRGEGGFGSTGV
ncbi:MAG TPA: dUTP diphosphatase [Thermoanaerobaculia bacterium]|nr:dUTP diphosphatase [Thermoanaerobaculia bacterium]